MPRIGKHKKLCYIECTFWSCKNYHIEFVVNAPPRVKVCIEKRGHRNLMAHQGSNAPAWCQRRRENGDNNV